MIQSIESGTNWTRQVVHLSNVDWSTYEQRLRIFEQHPGHRLAFDEGEIEILTPSLKHDDDADFLGHCVRVLAEELGLPLRGGGSVTLKREDMQKGIEPDRCFWVLHAPRMAGRGELDLQRDPPPDLAIEVDVTRSPLKRLDIYGKLSVSEVWRLEGEQLAFVQWDPTGGYKQATNSRIFRGLEPKQLMIVLR